MNSVRLLPRRRFHRFVFCAAGAYNIAWGLYSVWDPQWLFRYSGLPLQNHPQIFACLGMVVGLYGIIYFEVARVPERGWLLAAVGLTGKVLGPIGLLQLIWDACGRSRRSSCHSQTILSGGSRLHSISTTPGRRIDKTFGAAMTDKPKKYVCVFCHFCSNEISVGCPHCGRP